MVSRPLRWAWCRAMPDRGDHCVVARSMRGSSLVCACGIAPKAVSFSMRPDNQLEWRCLDHADVFLLYHRARYNAWQQNSKPTAISPAVSSVAVVSLAPSMGMADRWPWL